ncbi:MAG: insulinase family protein, partial [Muribaculaceae bacterium]|nr:insulinase family protein [Muribaculaceae bacterium]
RDYTAEKPLLDQIENLFEQYRSTTDSTERAKIYHTIDSVSYQASLIAIPNEYDKLMAGIGAKGTNAYTSYDATCYVEDIPSNRIEEWAIVQADRFKNPVLRGFHTELETIYEEKNMDLTRDNSKAFDAIFAELFANHPYGRQTILGTQQHLKNPSIKNVRLYHDKWYVPNNMAICVAGDFDPDEMVTIIEKYFGDMKPNENLEYLEIVPEKPITSPIVREVRGLDAEFEMLAWRLPAAKDADMTALTILNEILYNGKTGLIDKNINLPQKALGAYSFIYNLADQGAMILGGRPAQGQSLEDVRGLLLEQINALREGQFDQALIDAIITNLKLNLQQQLENNSDRVSNFVDAFTNGQTWAESVAEIKEIENITKDDIVRVANKYLGPDNYVAINKVTGEDTSIQKIAKAELTPIATNREYSSKFLNEVLSRPVKPIEPVFVDYEKDLTRTTAKDGEVEVLYTHNSTNDLFTLIYIYDYGYGADPRLTNASSFLDLIGTTDKSVTQIKDEFYALGCTFYISVGLRRSYVVISGLDENAEKAVDLAESLLSDANPDAEVWTRLVDRFEKSRA